MIISMEEYGSLRHEFLKVATNHISATALEELKSFYASAINSVRVSDSIRDVASLLRTLEKRGVLRHDNITPLRHIAKKYLWHCGINGMLDDYNARLKSYTPQYPPRTNLYQFQNGELFLPNTNINHLSCPPTVDPKSRLVIDYDLRDCNSCVVSLTSNKPELFVKYEFSGNSDENDQDNVNIEHKDCNLQILPYETRRICEYELEKLIEKVVSQVMTPPVALNTESEGNKPSASEDLDETKDVSEILLLTPQSVEPENVGCYSNVNNLFSKENPKINRLKVEEFLRRKYVRIFFIVFPFAIVFLLLIGYGFLKNSVHYNPPPSAPAPSYGWIEAPTNPYAGPNTPYNGNRHPDYNVTSQPTGITQTFSLQTLSPHESWIRDEIFNNVSRGITHKWRDVARRLGVREGDIDRIEAQPNSTYQQKALQTFRIFIAETDLRNWKLTFMRALEDARHKDLRVKVEDLLSRT